jgi:diguanylate cyclase (GGDEF)-like protein
MTALRWLFAFGGLFGLTMLQAHSGGVNSPYAVLLVMATIWFGVMATELERRIGFGVIVACCFGPMLIFGPPAYPVSFGHALLLVIVGASVALTLRAVTRELQRLNRSLREQASHDDLTGVLNRRGWTETAPRELARASRLGTPVALVLLDLDAFKALNDSRGHAEGDRILRETAARLTGALRTSDVVARLGGDEFVALLTDSTPDGAHGAVARLREVTPEIATFSAGIAVWDRAESLDELVKRCDLAQYAAKRAGGNAIRPAPGPLSEADFEPLDVSAE